MASGGGLLEFAVCDEVALPVFFGLWLTLEAIRLIACWDVGGIRSRRAVCLGVFANSGEVPVSEKVASVVVRVELVLQTC